MMLGKKFLTPIILFAVSFTPFSLQAQTRVFFSYDAGGQVTPLYRFTPPSSTKGRLLAAAIGQLAVDPASAAPFYTDAGSIHAKTKEGLRPILLYANVSDGLTVDSGTRSVVFIGGSSVRTLYSMGFNRDTSGKLPDPKALMAFSGTVTPRFVATLDSKFAFWSQYDENGTSAIYRLPLSGSGTPSLIYSQIDANEEGRTITALAVDSIKGVLYFCQKGSTSVIKALPLSQTTPTPLATYNGECRSLAMDDRNNNLFLAGSPIGSSPGLVAYSTSKPGDYFQFELGKAVSTVSVEPSRTPKAKEKPVPPVIDVVGTSATIYGERYFRGLVAGWKVEGILTHPSRKKESLNLSEGPAKFTKLKKGTYSIKYRTLVYGAGSAKDEYTPFSETRSFTIK